jgi:hypothetical protein
VNRELAYLPCAAHNLQLVLKDSFSECKQLLDKLFNKCTKFVTLCRYSSHIVEELRSFNKTVQKSVITRWNSYLFVIRSFNKLTKTEMNKLQNVISDRDKRKKNKFDHKFTKEEFKLMLDLQQILELFEYIFEKFQFNKITSSLIYPAITY